MRINASAISESFAMKRKKSWLAFEVKMYEKKIQRFYLFWIVKAGGFAKISHSAGTPDTMNVFVNCFWQVEIDDVAYVWNICAWEMVQV